MAKAGSKLVVELCEDGSVKIDGSGLIGTNEELVKELQALAAECGGELVVEKHVHKHGVSHTHGNKQHTH
jgi:hypothetical protein